MRGAIAELLDYMEGWSERHAAARAELAALGADIRILGNNLGLAQKGQESLQAELAELREEREATCACRLHESVLTIECEYHRKVREELREAAVLAALGRLEAKDE